MKLRLFFLIVAMALISPLMMATRIVVLADVHVVPGNECESKLKEAVAEINGIDADIVVMNGDLTNEGSDKELHNVKSILDGIKHKLYVLPGNHETTWSQSATKTIFDLWGNDRFVAEVDDLVIVGIACGPYMKMGDGHVKQEDLYWLDKTLSEKVAEGKRVVSFNHYPLLKDLDNFQTYCGFLKKYPVIAHVNGHYHKYEKYRSENGGINCMMVRSLDRKNGDFGYTIMDVTPDSVIFYNKQLGQEAVRVDAFASELPDATKTYESPLLDCNENMAYESDASIFTRLAIDEKAIYFGTSLGEVKAVAKNEKNKELWSVATGASLFARPIVAGDYLIVPSATKELLWIDRKTGEILQRDSSEGAYVADGVCLGNELYLGGYNKMEKWDVATRKLIWRFDSINNYCQAASVIAGNEIFFGAWDTYLYCLDASTGALKWKWNNGKKNNQLGPGNVVPVVTDDKVIIVAPDRYMTAIDRKTGKTIWRNKDHKYRESLGVSNDGSRVYAKTMDGELVAVSTLGNEFNELWIVDMTLGYEHAPCIVAENAEGKVFAGSRQGKVVKVDPIKRSVERVYNLGVSEINGIDIDPTTGNVYVSLIEGKIYQVAD